MQSPLLSGSFLKTKSLPPPKTVHSSLFSLNGTPKKRQSVKLLKKNSGFRLCSVSGKWTEPQFGNSEGAGLQDSPGMALPFCNSKSLKGNIQRFRDLNNCGFSRALSTKDLDTANIPLSHLPYGRLWKFLMLMGLFTLQGSQQALAGLDLPTGLQSIPILGDPGDISTGFASAFLLIFFSELGDKTFFIAALLAARNSAAVVFLGTFGALASMTIISVALGRTFHYVDEALPFRIGDADLPVDDIAAVCLLVYFGVSTLIEASSDDGTKGEEEQKEAELAVSEFSGNGAGILAAASTVISTFLLVFVAEWGDKSFFSTIALAAASSPLGVIGGAIAGHGVATLLAVLGGSLLGTFLSEKVIAYIGGSLFLVFAVVTLIEIVT